MTDTHATTPNLTIVPSTPTIDGSTADDFRMGTYDGPDRIAVGDVRSIALPTGSVALTITAPPSVNELAEIDGIAPSAAWSYYRAFLQDACNELWRIVEPGGRLAFIINPFAENPFLPVGAFASMALQIAGFQMRGEIVWAKSDVPLPLDHGVLRGPHNPPIVGVTERVLIASKLTDHRRNTRAQRRNIGMPFENTISPEQWANNRLDIWNIPAPPPGEYIHHAPFPVELAQRLIETHTYDGELVCDPMCGTASTALAAQRAGRRYVVTDIDPTNVDLAQQRLKAHAHQERPSETITQTTRRHPSATTQTNPDDFDQLGLDFA